MAAGRVLTGFSLPYVATYAHTGTTVTYSGGSQLARGVSVSVSAESSDNNVFYADNVSAETSGGIFTGGTVTLTVDGLKDAARTLIMGIGTTETITVGTGSGSSVSVEVYDDDQTAPYVGIAFVARYMEGGVTSYVPYLLTKCQFALDGLEAATQEDQVEFQTQELTASILRDDSAKHAWRKIAAAQTTETAALNVIKKFLSIT